MSAIEQIRNAIFPFRTYANWIFLIVLAGWTLTLVTGFFSGNSDWPAILLILAYLALAGLMILIIRNSGIPTMQAGRKKRDTIVNGLLIISFSAWVLSVVVGFFAGGINWSTSLMLLAFLMAAWFIDLNGNYEKKG
ncbi:MAG: hypothetical protein EA364_09655 [Balneolaceae bacterium]|jgi:hypothetical protein|nr:MAG: hypothetical protein EA364_09655 [Balneolaceae bacterium]